MDTHRFESLVRSLTAASSRRQALAVLGGGLALTLAGVSVQEADAKKKCPPCKKRKQGTCKKKKPDGTPCPGGTCQGGRCAAACAACTGDEVCIGGVCLVPACGAGGPCRVFLSSILYDGNLGGLSGADAKCQGLAAAAGVPGTYKAWLSDSTGSPSTRFVRSTGRYRLVNGTTIAANFTDLTDGTLLAPIDVTEKGGGFGADAGAWTHTKIDGTPGGAGVSNLHCKTWSANSDAFFGDVGDATFSNASWTGAATSFCDTPQHLYCSQQR